MVLQNLLLWYMEYCYQATADQIYKAPEALLEPDRNAVLLDCGCHGGEYTNKLAGMLGTSHVYGLELNRSLSEEARTKGIRVLRADANLSIPLQTESVTVVTAFNVLEHLIETKRFLQELYRVLVPGGYILLDTPNLASWHNIAALLVGLQPFSGPNIESMTESEVPIVRRMHRRAHNLPEDSPLCVTREPERHRHIVVVSMRSLVSALRRVGFQVEVSLGFGYYPLPPLVARIAGRIDPIHAHHTFIKARK